MKIWKTSDGINHVRLNSSEDKPTGMVTAYSGNTMGKVDTVIGEGDECFETDTATVYVYDAVAGWKEV